MSPARPPFIRTPAHGVIYANELTPAHLGRRVVLETLSGAAIEDELAGYMTDQPGKVRIFLRFRNVVSTIDSGPQPGAFPVLPNTSVYLMEAAA